MTLTLQKRPRRSAVPWCIAAGVLLCLGIGLYCERNRVRDWVVDDTKFSEEIRFFAGRHGIDPLLVRAVVFQESRFAYDAIGRRGEVGLMQVLPQGAAADWARVHKKPLPSHADLMRVEVNLEIGVWYLARALKRWKGYKDCVRLALVQYNAGAARAARWKPANLKAPAMPGIKIASTRAYVKKIMERYRKYSGEK